MLLECPHIGKSDFRIEFQLKSTDLGFTIKEKEAFQCGSFPRDYVIWVGGRRWCNEAGGKA